MQRMPPEGQTVAKITGRWDTRRDLGGGGKTFFSGPSSVDASGGAPACIRPVTRE